MKIENTLVRRMVISEVTGLDPIRVMVEDYEPGKGRINIECRGRSWSAFWGAMGEKSTITSFFCECSADYLAGNLGGGMKTTVFDPDGLKDSLKKELLAERRKGIVSGGFARSRYETIEDLSLPDDDSEIWAYQGSLDALMGEEWSCRLTYKPNPDYVYLTRIIKTVQEALKHGVSA